MSKTITTRDGRTLRIPTKKEAEHIHAAALLDPDCPPLTEAEAKKINRIGRSGYPNLRLLQDAALLDAEPVKAFRATGTGWESRIVRVLHDWLQTHSPMDA
ncbi:MAG: BrnA antitoxin family protein [Azoarcus sp.]|jgi:uncharacterized protein (DUF4415 family)|nr:BrnA antitoxin family protein [Azoarcus sp.]